MTIRGALTLAALTVLTACAGAFERAPAERQSTTAPPPARTAPVVTRQANRVPAAPPAQKLRISDLLGQTPVEIDARLGTPDLIRREGDGEVRIYSNPACILHVFAYPRGGTPQATHIEARTPKGQVVGDDADACLARFATS